MRRWTYLVGNQELIDVFEKGGSVHLLIASIIHPEMWKLYPGEKFKKEYAATWYQWVKNGNFSIIYGATRNKADLTYKCPGAYDLIARRFPEVPEFTTNCIQEVWNNFAWYHAPFVEVDGGYRLEVPLDDIFKAVNYKIQGGAGWMMIEAMIEISSCPEYLNSGAQIINQVHDSLTIELPRKALSQKVVEGIREAMEAPGYKYMPTSAASCDIITHYDEPEFIFDENNQLVEVPF